MGTRLTQTEMERLRDDEMERLRVPKRSRAFWRLASPQVINYEFRGQFGHPTSYAFVQLECAPADELSFESRAMWPSTVSTEYRAKLERAVAEAVADVLLEGVDQHSGCTVVLTEVRYDEVGSSEAAFTKAAKAAIRELLATKWAIVSGQTPDFS
jgi:translation elongation factor EF-G